MQLTLETTGGSNTVAALERGRLKVAGQWHTGNLIISADQLLAGWEAVSASVLSWEHIEPMLALKPEIILIGSGDSLAFPPASVSAQVLQRGIGFETMDTAAACRTFNILVAEQRRAVVGIIQSPG
jgi:uncharacterized protein